MGKFVVTEQIYVRSKLTIVDDAIAITGSANCDDRSLNGDGDTELAAIIVDNDVTPMDLGKGIKVNTRKFARELRMTLWKKHLSLSIVDKDYWQGDAEAHGANRGRVSHSGEVAVEDASS